MEVLDIINDIKLNIKEIIGENGYDYLNVDLDYLFIIYQKDLINILLNYLPNAKIMVNDSRTLYGVNKDGITYNSYGVMTAGFHEANLEEIEYLKKSFKELSFPIITELNKRLLNKGAISYILKKNFD